MDGDFLPPLFCPQQVCYQEERRLGLGGTTSHQSFMTNITGLAAFGVKGEENNRTGVVKGVFFFLPDAPLRTSWEGMCAAAATEHGTVIDKMWAHAGFSRQKDFVLHILPNPDI